MSTKNNQITITRPDDLHLHLLESDALKSVVSDSAKQFARAIIMPNMATPVTNVSRALTYRDEILTIAEFCLSVYSELSNHSVQEFYLWIPVRCQSFAEDEDLIRFPNSLFTFINQLVLTKTKARNMSINL